MRQRLRNLAPFALVLALSAAGWRLTQKFSPHCSGSVEYADRESAGMAAYLKGEYDAALRQYEANLHDSIRCGDNVGAYYSYWFMQGVYVAQRRDDEAEAAARQEIAYAEKMHGTDDPFLLTALSDLTMSLLRQNRLSEAEAVNERALKIIQRGSVGEWGAAARVNLSLSEVIKQRKAEADQTPGQDNRKR